MHISLSFEKSQESKALNWTIQQIAIYQQIVWLSCKVLHGGQMSQYPLSWNARADLKKSNVPARDLFYFVSFISDHPVYVRIKRLFCYSSSIQLCYKSIRWFRRLTQQMIFGQVVTFRCQISIGKICSRPCEYFGVVGLIMSGARSANNVLS